MNTSATAPWVSEVVVSHNDGAWLARCVGSIRQQTVFDRIGLILVEDGSDNGTEESGCQLAANLPNGRYGLGREVRCPCVQQRRVCRRKQRFPRTGKLALRRGC